jgi:hypothetical protein
MASHGWRRSDTLSRGIRPWIAPAEGAVAPRPPPPVVNLKASTTVLIDGKNIPSTATTRVVNDSSGFDGRADPPYPDITSWR